MVSRRGLDAGRTFPDRLVAFGFADEWKVCAGGRNVLADGLLRIDVVAQMDGIELAVARCVPREPGQMRRNASHQGSTERAISSGGRIRKRLANPEGSPTLRCGRSLVAPDLRCAPRRGSIHVVASGRSSFLPPEHHREDADLCAAAGQNVLAIASAMARLAVRPGDSMPNRLTRPRTPWSFSRWIRKSVAEPPGRAILGRIPA